MKQKSLYAGVTALLLLSGASSAAEPDIRKLAAAAEKTAEHMEKTPCSWRCVFTREMPGQVLVEVVRTPKRKRWTVSVASREGKRRLLTVIERDGAWYVSQLGGLAGRGKYRPFEAPLKITTLYLYLRRAEPLFVTAGAAKTLGTYETTVKRKAIYRTPLPAEAKRQLAAMIANFEAMAKKDPKLLAQPGRKEMIAELKRLVDMGMPSKVDLANGMVVEFGSQKLRTRLEDFKWLKAVEEKTFAVDGDWEDCSSDPTARDLSSTVLIGHAPMKTEPDNCLLDLKTGRVRRVAYRGAVSLSGCFLKDRKKLVVSGTDVLEGRIGLHEIDLASGKNRSLGGKLLASGVSLFPRLSPDGRTLAVFHRSSVSDLAKAQVVLVDLPGGEARAVGRPGDWAHVNWSADGKSLLLTMSKPEDLLNPAENRLARLDLDGKLTEIRKGTRPLALPGGKRILFRDEDDLWKTCDLTGKDVVQIGDGLKGLTSPALSPDGKKLIMIRGPEGRQTPVIVSLDTGKVTPVKVAPGNWVFPSWR